MATPRRKVMTTTHNEEKEHLINNQQGGKEDKTPEGDWIWGTILFLVVLAVQLFKLL